MKYDELLNHDDDNITFAKESEFAYKIASVSESCLNDNTPYTIEELDARLEQAEKDFKDGKYFSNESVIAELNQFVQVL